MRTLTTQANTARQRRAVRLTRLCTLTLPGLTLQLSDRALRLTKGGVPHADEWWPYVLSWGRTSDGLGLLTAAPSRRGTLDLILNNAKPILGRTRFSDLFRSGLNTTGYDLAFATLTVQLLLGDGAVEDAVTVFSGQVDDVVQITSTACTLRCSDRLLMVPDESATISVGCSGSLLSTPIAAIFYNGYTGPYDTCAPVSQGVALGLADLLNGDTYAVHITVDASLADASMRSLFLYIQVPTSGRNASLTFAVANFSGTGLLRYGLSAPAYTLTQYQASPCLLTMSGGSTLSADGTYTVTVPNSAPWNNGPIRLSFYAEQGGVPSDTTTAEISVVTLTRV